MYAVDLSCWLLREFPVKILQTSPIQLQDAVESAKWCSMFACLACQHVCSQVSVLYRWSYRYNDAPQGEMAWLKCLQRKRPLRDNQIEDTREGKLATTLSSETSGQRTSSVDHAENLCSIYLLSHRALQQRAREQRGGKGVGRRVGANT